MIKMVCEVWKKPDMTQAQFEKRWLVEHGKLVKQHAKAMGMIRYVQSHKIPSESIDEFGKGRGWKEPFDGLTEIWWESVESMEKAFSSPEGQEASKILQQDEEQFIDTKKISAFLSEEKVIF
jgi:uncharacterized protein (TIGR02118 family)